MTLALSRVSKRSRIRNLAKRPRSPGDEVRRAIKQRPMNRA